METTRQKKIGSVIQQDLTVILQQLLKETLSKSVIASVTKVRVSSDLSSAKTYISVFPVKNTKMIFDLFSKKKKCHKTLFGFIG
jgi:ribosome-binding factor A